MTRKLLHLAAATVIAPCLFAAPAAEKRDPVADGFPDWEGLTAKNHFIPAAGKSRRMTPSDLRHKVVVVVEADVSDLKKFQTEQLPLAARLASLNACFSSGFEASLGTLMTDTRMPRSSVVLLSLRGKPSEELKDAFTAGKDKALAQKITPVTMCHCPIYFNAGLVGAPENTEGKYPFAYVIGAKGGEPLWKGVLTATTVDEAIKAAKAAVKDVPEWTPLTGVAEAQTQKSAFKMIKDGKIKAAQKVLLGGIKSKDAETAAEAQKMYDAIVQYQTDMTYLIECELSISAALASSELTRFAKLFPTAKKSLSAQLKAISSVSGAQQMGDIITKMRLWSSEDYQPKNAAEMKKNLQEIVKWKKVLAQFEKSENMKVQGDALYLKSTLESLEATLKSKSVSK